MFYTCPRCPPSTVHYTPDTWVVHVAMMHLRDPSLPVPVWFTIEEEP